MKITIEPTMSADPNYRSIVVAVQSDDLDIEKAMELIKDALRAWGFSEEAIREYWK